MARPVLYGADYSVYVRIARLALIEKGVEYEHVPVDVFAEGGPPGWYRDHHPFGRIPALSHGDFTLYETAAITRYVDDAFDGPALQPGDPKTRAVMAQMIGLLDSYAYRSLVWDIAVQTVNRPAEGKAPDLAIVARGQTQGATALAELSRLKRAGDWLLGETLTLADLHAAPIIGFFLRSPLAADMMASHPALTAWWGRISVRPSWTGTAATIRPLAGGKNDC